MNFGVFPYQKQRPTKIPNQNKANMSADSELTLTVELPDGLSESLTVRASTRVSSLRNLIAAQFGESNATNLLTLSDDTKLDNSKSLSDYPQLLEAAAGGGSPRVRAQMQIYIKFFRRKGFMLDVAPGTDVELIKAMVYNKDGPAVPVHKQKLTHKGRALTDSMTLAGAGVRDNDEVLVYVRDMTHSPENGCILFFVDIKGEEIMELTNMRPSDTVAELKRCLADPHVGDVPYGSQRISLAGNFFDEMVRVKRCFLCWTKGLSYSFILDPVLEMILALWQFFSKCQLACAPDCAICCAVDDAWKHLKLLFANFVSTTLHLKRNVTFPGLFGGNLLS